MSKLYDCNAHRCSQIGSLEHYVESLKNDNKTLKNALRESIGNFDNYVKHSINDFSENEKEITELKYRIAKYEQQVQSADIFVELGETVDKLADLTIMKKQAS